MRILQSRLAFFCKRTVLVHFFSSKVSYFFTAVASKSVSAMPNSFLSAEAVSGRSCEDKYAIIDLCLRAYSASSTRKTTICPPRHIPTAHRLVGWLISWPCFLSQTPSGSHKVAEHLFGHGYRPSLGKTKGDECTAGLRDGGKLRCSTGTLTWRGP